MATSAQILANRENAQHSTGPRTAEGKAKSSLNNLQHGLAARGFIVLPGQEAAFEELEYRLGASLNPSGALQDVLFTRILECTWNLHRCRLAEAQLYADNTTDPGLDPLLDEAIAAKAARIQKYAKSNENSILRLMRELSRIQTECQYRHEVHPLSPEELEDHEKFNQTPHSLSEVCEFAKVQAQVMDRQKAQSRILQTEAKSATRNFIAHLKALGSVPTNDQNSPFEVSETGEGRANAA